MENRKAFMIRFPGVFHACELYNAKGNHVYSLQEAIDVANDMYGDGWLEVYNGSLAAVNSVQELV